MTRFGLAGAAALVLCGVASPLACGGEAFTVGGGDDGGSSGGDAQVLDGPSGADGTSPEGGPHDGSPPPADAPQEAAPGSIVFVSTTSGNDANDGTNSSQPKKTIAAALTRAQSITTSPEVHVCAGTYAEKGLSLTQTLKLLGSYDCSTWTQTATNGLPTTTIQNADPTAQASTLVVTGAVGPSAVVGGFHVVGATSFAGTTAGVETEQSASPVFQNDVIEGGGGTGASGKPGSIGAALGGSGSPQVTACVVTGGKGTGNVGSIGIAVGATGTPYVTASVVSGGSGAPANPATDTASIGVLVSSNMSQANALKDLIVYGNDDGAASTGSTIGIDVLGPGITVEIEACLIEGGAGAGTSTSYSAGVVVADASGTARVIGSHVHGGVRTAGGSTYGVFVEGASVLNVHDSEIHAGSTSGPASGVLLVSATNASVVDDTIYTGSGAGSAITINSGVSGVVVTDDLLLGSNSSSQIAVSLPSCTASQIASLDHTAFVNFGTLYACGSTQATTVATMAVALPSASTAGDIEIGSGGACTASALCSPDPSCPNAPATCIPSILGASWTTTDDGSSGLFSGAPGDAGPSFKGWWLPEPTTLCALARGGTPFPGISTDIFGQLRDASKPTIGAFEYTSTKCQ
jgi:hypothetical protein